VSQITQLLAVGDKRLFKMIHRWEGILLRCHDPRSEYYPLYGGRGIFVCEEWHDFRPFFNFWGLPPNERSSMERVDNNKGYEPSNCRWSHVGEQNMNTRRNKLITHNGETRILSEWAKVYDINPQRLSERLSRGWSFERAVSTPCPRGFEEGRRRHIENSRKSWEKNGKAYTRNSRERRLLGLHDECGLLLNPRNHGNAA
jgi:hypothetical protein